MAVSFGTRKALGRRYGQDPALALELERLEKEYSLIPSREARAFNEKSLAQQQSQYDQNRKDAKAAGIMGTAANLGTTAAIYRGMTKAPGEPFFVNPWAAKEPIANIITPQVGQSANAVMGMNAAPSYITENASLAPGAYAVNPAVVDATSSGIAAGADVGMGASAGTSAASVAADAIPYVAAYTGSRMAGGMLENQPWAPKEVTGILKHPATGVVGEGSKLLGKATGIKELENFGREVERIEDQVVDFITDPFGSLGDAFGW